MPHVLYDLFGHILFLAKFYRSLLQFILEHGPVFQNILKQFFDRDII